jgi:outer membrane receptor protein involved in Fe transport
MSEPKASTALRGAGAPLAPFGERAAPATARGRLIRSSLCATTALLVCASAPAAMAQSAAGAAGPGGSQNATEVAEVIVTATRQAQVLSKVPLSVTAYNEAQLDSLHIREIDDLSRLTPGLQFSRSTEPGLGSSISIRGVSSDVGASTTGIYIDDTPIQMRTLGNSISNTYPQIFDLERVEALRGPQGTLFGAGAEGGALRFITPEPSRTQYSVYGRGELAFTKGGDPTYELGVATGGPIIADRLGFRVSVWGRQQGGYIDRVSYPSLSVLDKNADWTKSGAVRLAFKWQPTERLTVEPSLFYQTVDQNSRSLFFSTISDPSNGVLRNGHYIREPNLDSFGLGAVRVNYGGDGFDFISNTSYFDRKNKAIYDYVNGLMAILGAPPYAVVPGQVDNAYITNWQSQFSQEFRLQSSTPSARLNWVAGLYFSSEEQRNHQFNYDPTFDAVVETLTAGVPGCGARGCDTADLLGAPLQNGVSLFSARYKARETQSAAFGQVDYTIIPKLKLTAGVRVSRVGFKYDVQSDGPFSLGPSSGAEHQTAVTPKFGVSYQYNPETLFYLSAAKGFRPGGAQAALPSECAPDLAALGLTASSAAAAYKEDSLWNYEAGVKNRSAGGRVQFEASAFDIEWSNIQQQVPLPECAASFIANLGTAVSRGFDLQYSIQATDNLKLSGSVAYTDAHFTKTLSVGAGEIIAQKGEVVPNSGSPWSATVQAEYRRPISGKLSGFGQVQYEYHSRGPRPDPALFQFDPRVPSDPATNYLSLRGGVSSDRWTATLFVDNLFNSLPVLGVYHDVKTSPLFYESTFRPRTIGFNATYRY